MVPPYFASGILHLRPQLRCIGRTRTGCYPCHLRSGFNLIPVRLALNVGSLCLVFDLLVSFIKYKYVIHKHCVNFTSHFAPCQEVNCYILSTNFRNIAWTVMRKYKTLPNKLSRFMLGNLNERKAHESRKNNSEPPKYLLQVPAKVL